MADGCSSEDAARGVGASTAVEVRWFRECGRMFPSHLSPSASPRTGRDLSLAEREQIALLRTKRSRETAQKIARSVPTMSREPRSDAATGSAGFRYQAVQPFVEASRRIVQQSTHQWRRPHQPKGGDHEILHGGACAKYPGALLDVTLHPDLRQFAPQFRNRLLLHCLQRQRPAMVSTRSLHA